MPAAGVPKGNNKRKRTDREPELSIPQNHVQLEMLTDEEDGPEIDSDDGEADDFPEIDTGSDSESSAEGSGKEGEGGWGGSDEDEDEDEDESDDSGEEDEESEDDSEITLNIFPKSQTVISNITGQPKHVYPEIEPDYDSDSSTEDVRVFPSNTHQRT